MTLDAAAPGRNRRVEGALGKELREVRGEVWFDEVSRGIYATDASNYQILPVAVVVPRDEEDVRAAVRIAARHRVPVLPRGGGTSLAGQTVGAALVLDVSKHLNAILEIDVAGRWARVQPGVVRDQLNAAAAEHGLHFAPDPATSSRANVGGMIGNNSSGTRSLRYGKTIDHVLELRVLLADGSELTLGEVDATAAADGGRAATILRGLREIVDGHRDEIAERFPKTLRRVGGYPLDELLADDDGVWNPAKVLVGSEGTLGIVLEAKVRLEPLPRHTSMCVAHFREVLDAVRAVEPILTSEPSAVEILDRTVIELARHNLSISILGKGLLEDEPGAILIVEFFADSAEEAAAKPRALRAELERRGLGYAWPIYLDKQDQERVWAVRRSGLGLMLGMKGDRKPLAFIEDAAVPIDVLPEYVEKVLAFCRGLGVGLALYAHASVGVLHLRPILDLRRADDLENMKKIAEEAFGLVRKYGGSWSSEHGDGLARSAFNERFFGPRLYRAFKDVKRLFDPDTLFNPGKIVDAPPMDENLRFGTSYRVPPLPTNYRYRDAGGFAAAVEMCSGVGQCRKLGGGTMCPSYMATRDEEHSTRGRANALRLAMSGQLGADALTDRRLLDVLDLCLACKACKAECPSNVDMAKLKAEVLQGFHDRHGTGLRERLVARTADAARWLSGPPASAVNAVQRSALFRRTLEHLARIDRRRTLPAYALEPFARWLASRARPEPSDRRVVLFADTWLSYFEPRVGIAATELLESCGYEVIPARVGCCQRPRLSKGFLRAARRAGERTLRRLDDYLRQGLDVVVCEPSCASALTDDLPDLVEDDDLGRRVAERVVMIDVFLAREIDAGRLDVDFVSSSSSVVVHGHCHQKALYGTSALTSLLRRVPSFAVTELDAGCCGMAGSFGYEKEHYELSRLIGEDRLFPALDDLGDDETVIACGFSCRQQIEHFTGRRPVHWVEVLRATGTSGSEGPGHSTGKSG